MEIITGRRSKTDHHAKYSQDPPKNSCNHADDRKDVCWVGQAWTMLAGFCHDESPLIKRPILHIPGHSFLDFSTGRPSLNLPLFLLAFYGMMVTSCIVVPNEKSLIAHSASNTNLSASTQRAS